MNNFKPFNLDTNYYTGRVTDSNESLLNVLRILISFMSTVDALEYVYSAKQSNQFPEMFGYGVSFTGITLNEWLNQDE